MQISLLEARAVARRLSALIEEHDRISIAVAWGGITPVAETLLANESKFESILLGLDFSASDPDLIDRFVDVPNAFVAKNRPGCFHPKILYFQSRTTAEAIIGSANFTKGGLGSNLEARSSPPSVKARCLAAGSPSRKVGNIPLLIGGQLISSDD